MEISYEKVFLFKSYVFKITVEIKTNRSANQNYSQDNHTNTA